MTEKKKRGRPPKAKKEDVPPLPDGVTEISRSLNTKGGFAIDTEKFSTPFPDNWDSLGKVAKLQWLTENKKK